MRTFTSTIELDAAPDRVWRVLTDTAIYPSWNLFITKIDLRLDVGEKIDTRIASPGGKPMTFHPTVTAVEFGRKLGWLGRLPVPGLFDGAHSFALEPLAGGGTRFTQTEKFSGVLVWSSASCSRTLPPGSLP